nr:MAG TPA: hypothetical protein [Caudoviricetes sp.]
MDFLRAPKNVVPQYKLAILMIEDYQYPFNYNKISREDMQRITLLKNIALQDNEITISTTDDYPFDVQQTIYIRNDKYSISSMYSEDSFNENNMFNFSIDSPVRYLILRRLGK